MSAPNEPFDPSRNHNNRQRHDPESHPSPQRWNSAQNPRTPPGRTTRAEPHDSGYTSVPRYGPPFIPGTVPSFYGGSEQGGYQIVSNQLQPPYTALGPNSGYPGVPSPSPNYGPPRRGSHPHSRRLPRGEGSLIESSSPELSESVDPSYYVRSRDFFIEGRVFAVIMNETAGDTSRPLDYNTSRSLNKVRFNNNWVYTNTRRFIVVRKKREFCYACPIFTYSGRATTKSGVVPGEHSIVYSRGTDPTLLNGEYGITKPPIVVDMTAGENYLQFASRIYFGIHHPIQYNVKVKDVGQVPEEAIPLLIGNWREENRADQDSRQSASYHPQISPYSYHPTHNLYGWHETLAPECYHPEHNKEGFHYTGNRCGYHSVSNPFGYNSQIAPDNYHPELNPEGYHSEKNPTGYHPISNPTVYSSKRNPHAYHQTKNPYGYSTVYYHAYHPVHNPHGYHYLHNPYGYDPNSNPTAYHPQYNPNGIRPPVVADSVGDITQALQVTTL
ncbi:hypothetical protein PtrSN002B_011703 [Pyrenophora tritici-repentis]|uniref:DUF6590 domain-containing protein n=1 Tax=Pyrenophora tritici-repentis TaxID=45151 RepID=A0A834SA13_9PLEO|nr:hypothetical protein A1F99_026570 [Pyrenophora tritici-repentis]KAF7578584.1 hypothetical protein PtrM4_028240 [Pyrenophora tritici-repentis]KAI0575468.1 hypothetical protein Alg215_08018 [Pyrenophora tritici-repentis]KAI0620307.1 hypothetical protein TUN199_07700 [Pyrenophora tritici-repentis]KAI1525801.1 hypothetical protein PtrSN002B_011703 [Pyrenophora tritici-repentis]